MKKVIFLLPFLLLLAAGCNSQVSTGGTGDNSQSVNAKASGDIDVINASLQGDANNEQSVVQQSDQSTVLNSDSAELNGYQGVANGTAY